MFDIQRTVTASTHSTGHYKLISILLDLLILWTYHSFDNENDGVTERVLKHLPPCSLYVSIAIYQNIVSGCVDSQTLKHNKMIGNEVASINLVMSRAYTSLRQKLQMKRGWGERCRKERIKPNKFQTVNNSKYDSEY